MLESASFASNWFDSIFIGSPNKYIKINLWSNKGQNEVKSRSKQCREKNKRLPLLCHPRFIIRAWLASQWLVDPSMHNFSARSSLSIRRWRNSASNFSVNLPSDFNFLADFFLSFSISCLKMHGLSV